MPLSADPNDTIPASLKLDEDKPAESRPTFHLRFLTSRQYRLVSSLIRQASEEKDDEKAEGLLDQAISIGLVRTSNINLAGPPSELLTIIELWELAYMVLNKPRLEEDSRKKLSSQSTTAPVNSASDAPK